MRVRADRVVLLLTLGIAAHVAAQTPAPGASRTRGNASIAGRVINPDGSAAANARVVVYAVVEDAPAAVVATTTSTYDGRYEAGGLPPGEFMVGVTAPSRSGGFGGESKRPTAMPVESFYPGVVDRNRAEPVRVFEGIATEGIDVWLAPAPQRFTISGRVFWPDGMRPDDLTLEYGGPGAIRRGIWYLTDPGGLFTIEGAAAGTYVLLARGNTPAGPLIGIASTDVAIGPVEDVRVTLRVPGSIEGLVTFEGTTRPAGVDLQVIPQQMLLTLSPLYPVTETPVGGDGRFTIQHVYGEYTLTVKGLPAAWRIRRVLRNGSALPDSRIIVPAGERVTGIEVVMGIGAT